MTIFCKIGLPGFIVSLAIAGALLVATFISIAIIDKVSNDNIYVQDYYNYEVYISYDASFHSG